MLHYFCSLFPIATRVYKFTKLQQNELINIPRKSNPKQ